MRTETPWQSHWMPDYIRLDLVPATERPTYLLASAALPLGIFPEVDLHGALYTDGGMADNTPLYPLAALERCDELVVIRLRPTARVWPIVAWENCKLIAHRIGLPATRRPNMRQLPYASTPSPCPDTPPRILTCAPRHGLGWFNTVNFGAAYADRLLKAGYRDARALIRQEFTAANPTE